MKRSRLTTLALTLVTAPAASALTLGFDNITGNNALNAAIGEAQLTVDVTDALGGEDLLSTQALFTFRNTGSEAAIIRQVYFDDGTLLGISTLIDADEGVGGDPGVDFSHGSANPGVLPGGNTLAVPFVVTAGFLADADTPQPNDKGIAPGEFLGVLFDLQTGQDLGSVFEGLALPNGGGTGDLRIGVHVQAFANGGSESFVNSPVAVPESSPSVEYWMLTALLGLAAAGRLRYSPRTLQSS